jgi:hypothetical protein
MHVDVKDLPEPLKSVFRRLSAMKRVHVSVGETFSAPGAYGKGFRGQAVVVNLATGDSQYQAGSWGGENPFSRNPVDDPSGVSPLPPGFAAFTTGGRYWELHLNPANVTKVLTAPPESHALTHRELWLLWTFRALSSSGRRDEWERSRSGYRENPVGGPPSQAELAELAKKGVINVNRAGAAQITTAGRNVIGRMSDHEIVQKARESGAKHDAPARGAKREITAEDLLLPVGVKPSR